MRGVVRVAANEIEDSDTEESSEDPVERSLCDRVLDVSDRKKKDSLCGDMWSICIIILCKDYPQLFNEEATRKSVHWVRFSFGATSQVINLTLQLVILTYVRQYVSNPQVSGTQFNYYRFHKEVFDDDGTFNETKWKTWDGPFSELCQSSLSKMVFTGFILFLWSTRMLSEARDCINLHTTLTMMPGRPQLATDADMVQKIKEVNDDGEEELTGEEVIVFLSHATRVAIYLLVVIPKFMVMLLLTAYGCDWLVATESYSDLILNALALEFIIGIDELILQNFFPEGAIEAVENTSFAYDLPVRSKKERHKAELCEYYWSMFYVAVVFLFTFLYLSKFQMVLPLYNGDIAPRCKDPRISAQFTPPCGPFQDNCFPFGLDATPPPGMDLVSMGMAQPLTVPPEERSKGSQRRLQSRDGVTNAVLQDELDSLQERNLQLRQRMRELQQEQSSLLSKHARPMMSADSD